MPGTPAMHERSGCIDHRPCKTGQKTQSARKVCHQQYRLLPPCKHSFHSELWECLHPSENCQGKALGDKELGRFGAPGDEKRGDKDGRDSPKCSPRARVVERYDEKKKSQTYYGMGRLLWAITQRLPRDLLWQGTA